MESNSYKILCLVQKKRKEKDYGLMKTFHQVRDFKFLPKGDGIHIPSSSSSSAHHRLTSILTIELRRLFSPGRRRRSPSPPPHHRTSSAHYRLTILPLLVELHLLTTASPSIFIVSTHLRSSHLRVLRLHAASSSSSSPIFVFIVFRLGLRSTHLRSLR